MELDPSVSLGNLPIYPVLVKAPEIAISEHDSEDESFQPPKKRRREDLCQRIAKFKDASSPLAQAKKYQNLIKYGEELLQAARYYQQFNAHLAQEEIEKEWAELGIDPIAWEKKIFEDPTDSEITSQVKISKQFKHIINDDRLRDDLFRQLQIIFGIFMKHRQDPSIEPKALKRINDSTSIFEQTITLSVNGNLIPIPKRFLLRCGSSYFNHLFESNLISDSCNLEPLELNLDEETFRLLERFLREEDEIFFDKEFSEILEFLHATCQFDIPSLVQDCDCALAEHVTEENVFSLLEEVYQFLKESKKRGLNFVFPELQSGLLIHLHNNELSLTSYPSSPPADDWLLESKTEIDIAFLNIKELDKILSLIENMSIFKEMNSIHLNIVDLYILNEEQQKKLVACFPNTEKIVINFEYTTDFEYITDWNFLTNFDKLKEVTIHSNLMNDDYFSVCFEKFPKKEEWQIFFEIAPYFSEGSNLSLDVDHFIEIKILESTRSTFHNWPIAIRPYVEDRHLQKLIEAQKFDFESPFLNLIMMSKITLETLGLLLTNMTKLEELFLYLDHRNLPSFVKCLQQFAPCLKKLTLPFQFFLLRDAYDGLHEYIQRQCQDLNILIHSTDNHSILPSWIVYFKKFKSLQVTFQSWGGARLIVKPNSFKIELENNNYNSQIGEGEESRAHLTHFSQVLQHFSGLPIVLDMKDVSFSSQTLIGLSQAFPYIKELQLECYDFNPVVLKGFYQLKTLTFKSPNFLNQFSQLQDLQNYPVDILFDELGIESSSLEEFIRKVRVYMDLLPNFQPLAYLTPEYRASMTNRDLLLLTPKKCYTFCDLNGMKRITSTAVLEIVKAHPRMPLLITNCQSLHQEMIEGKLSIDDFLELADHNYIWGLFYKKVFAHLRKQLSDQHISKLSHAKKIPSHRTLNVSEMPLLHSAGFLRLLKEVKPKSVIMYDTPGLYSTLKFEASDIENVSLSFEALKDKDFLLPFLTNYLKEGVKKALNIKLELSDFDSIDEQTIAELTRKGLVTRLRSPEVHLDIDSKGLIAFNQCEINRTLSEDSKHLLALSRLSHSIPKALIIIYPHFLTNQPSPLDAIIHHFSHFKFTLCLSFNEEMLKNRKNFEILTQCANLGFLILTGDEKLLPNTPALDLFKNLPCPITLTNNDLKNIKNIETFIEKIKELGTLFPNRHPLDLTYSHNDIRAQFTDELLFQNKPEKNQIKGTISFKGMSQITLAGLLKYLEGLQFIKLDISGCTKVISEGGIQELQKLYPEIEIFPSPTG